MATVALGVAGAFLGNAAFGTATFLGVTAASWGYLVGSAVGGYLFAPSGGGGGGGTVKNEGPRLSDLSVGGSSYGSPIYDVFGAARVPGNMIWASGLHETSRTETIEVGGGGGGGGGKGGGGGGGGGDTQTVETTYYYYDGSFGVALCRGPIYGVRRIWLNKKLVFDLGDTATEASVAASNAFLGYLTTYTGAADQTQDSGYVSYYDSNVPAYRSRAMATFFRLPLADYNNIYPTLEAEVVENGQLFGGNQITRLPRSVAYIIETLCERAGLQAAELDTSLLSDDVQGYITEAGTYAAKLGPLLDAFAIDAVMVGRTLAFRPRASASVLTIAAEDLVPTDGGLLQKTRAPEHEMPASVEVSYYDPYRDYQVNTQTVRRSTGAARGLFQLQLALVLFASDARQIAQRLLWSIWTARTTYRLSLSARYLALEPGDVVTITETNITHTVKITRITYGANLVMELEGIAHDAALYESDVAGDTGEVQPPSIGVAGDATPYFLNLPALLSTHGAAGYYAGATSAQSAWKSASVLRSVDGGATYTSQYTLAPFVVAGTAASVLASGGHYTWDDTNTVDVLIIRGSLSSATDAAVLAGANGMLLGDEIIQFATATLIGTLTYRLSRLLRGRRGTEAYVGTHVINERCVVLNGVKWIERPVAEVGASYLYKPVSNGQAVSDAEAVGFEITGQTLYPWAGVHPSGARDSGDLTVSWVRRDRLGQELPGGVDLLMSESVEAYEVDVMDGATVVRTLSAATTSVEYTAAQQTTDFGSPQSSVAVRIYQLSTTVGRGAALTATV